MNRRQYRSFGRRRARRSNLPTILGLVLLFGALLVVIGIFRYDGPVNLALRVYAEIAGRQPRTHSLFVPTPAALSNLPDPLGARPGESETQPSADSAATATPAPATDARPTPDTPPAVELTGLNHIWQTWNNCGPATLAMNLSHYGLALTQAEVGATLRPNADDKNVGPEELADYARSQGFYADVRINGDATRLRQLLDSGIPVLIETWHEAEPDNGMGHYRLLTGYNDASQEWIAYDSFDTEGVDPNQPYAGIRVSYARMDHLWSVFNRLHVIVYPVAYRPTVEHILGQDLEDAAMWQRARRDAQAATETEPGNGYAWFNLGSDLVALGQFDQAAAAYDQARRAGLPWRMLWYQFGPFEAYYGVGRFNEVIALADATLQTTNDIEEVYYWKGLALNALGNSEEARKAWQRALDLNPDYADAIAALTDQGS